MEDDDLHGGCVAPSLLRAVVRLLEATGSFTGANEKMLAEMVWPHFWAIQIVLLVLIFNYVVMHELARVAGRGKMREIFFGRPRQAVG